jgi:hypothetical protein
MYFFKGAIKYISQFQLLGLHVYLSLNVYVYILKTKNSVRLHEVCTSETCLRMIIDKGTAKFRKKSPKTCTQECNCHISQCTLPANNSFGCCLKTQTKAF